MTREKSINYLCLQFVKNLHLYNVLLAILFTWQTGAQKENPGTYLDVRLVGGSDEWEGNVEVLYQGAWGSVCDDSWDVNDGLVVCRQLGYPSIKKVTTSTEFIPGYFRPMVLDEVTCAGTESNLGLCQGTFGEHDCMLSEIAGVVCGLHEPAPLQVRLTDDSVPWKGVVEVFYQGEWGSVCDDSWDIEDGRVVCRQLGYESVVRITTAGWSNQDDWPFSVSDKPILLDEMQCTGTESNLGLCPGKFGADAHNCQPNESAGVVCTHDEDEVLSPTVRLVGGGAAWRGRVEVYYNGEWGTVCDDGWTFQDAQVVCRQLGFHGAIKTYDGTKFGSGTVPILLDDTACVGTESTLQDCHGSWGIGSHNCDHFEDAGVACRTDAAIHEIRLEGPYPNQGRVEIFIDGEWGTVCDDGWDVDDANVVCRQLSYPRAVLATAGGMFGEGVGPIHLDEVDCEGQEASIYLCEHSSVGMHNCFHNEDAGVVCESFTDPNYVATPTSETSGEFGSVGFTVMGIILPAFLVLTLCLVCRNACKNNSSDEAERTHGGRPSQNNVYTPALESRSELLDPPSAGIPHLTVILPSASNGRMPAPRAPDLPPAYNTVMEDPSKFAFPPGQIGADGTTDIPVTPPPEYTPQAVVFNTDTNSVNLVTMSSTTA